MADVSEAEKKLLDAIKELGEVPKADNPAEFQEWMMALKSRGFGCVDRVDIVAQAISSRPSPNLISYNRMLIKIQRFTWVS